MHFVYIKRVSGEAVYPQNRKGAIVELSHFASSLMFCSSWTRVLEKADA
jgi:hypothetical protein